MAGGESNIPGGDGGGPSYGFTGRDAARIGRTVRRVEGYYLNAPPARARWPVGGSAAVVAIAITSNVTAGTETTPTTFNMKLMVLNGAGPGLLQSGSTLTGYNRASGTTVTASTGSPKSGWATKLGGHYYLVSADC